MVQVRVGLDDYFDMNYFGLIYLQRLENVTNFSTPPTNIIFQCNILSNTTIIFKFPIDTIILLTCLLRASAMVARKASRPHYKGEGPRLEP